MPTMLVNKNEITVDGDTCRVDVHRDIWDDALERTVKSSAKHMGGKDPAILGKCRLGYFRLSVRTPLFDAAKERLKT